MPNEGQVPFERSSEENGGLSAEDISSYTDGWLTHVASVSPSNHLAEIVK